MKLIIFVSLCTAVLQITAYPSEHVNEEQLLNAFGTSSQKIRKQYLVNTEELRIPSEYTDPSLINLEEQNDDEDELPLLSKLEEDSTDVEKQTKLFLALPNRNQRFRRDDSLAKEGRALLELGIGSKKLNQGSLIGLDIYGKHKYENPTTTKDSLVSVDVLGLHGQIGGNKNYDESLDGVDVLGSHVVGLGYNKYKENNEEHSKGYNKQQEHHYGINVHNQHHQHQEHGYNKHSESHEQHNHGYNKQEEHHHGVDVHQQHHHAHHHHQHQHQSHHGYDKYEQHSHGYNKQKHQHHHHHHHHQQQQHGHHGYNKHEYDKHHHHHHHQHHHGSQHGYGKYNLRNDDDLRSNDYDSHKEHNEYESKKEHHESHHHNEEYYGQQYQEYNTGYNEGHHHGSTSSSNDKYQLSEQHANHHSSSEHHSKKKVLEASFEVSGEKIGNLHGLVASTKYKRNSDIK